MRACDFVLIGPMLMGLFPATTNAQSAPPTATEALASALATICAGGPTGALAARCSEIAAGGGNALVTAAAGQRLEEIPGQARLANRGENGAPEQAAASPTARWDLLFSLGDGRMARSTSRVEAGFDADTRVGLAGVAWRPSTRWTLGLLWQWNREDLAYRDSASRTRADLDGALVTGSWQASEHWSLDAYTGRLDGHYRLSRDIDYMLGNGPRVSTQALARPEVDREVDGLGLHHDRAIGAWAWSAGLRHDRSRTRIAAYSESQGLGLGLSLPERRIATRQAALDFAVSRTFSSARGVWVPRLRVSTLREFDDPQRTLTLRLSDDASATPIRFLTQEPDRQWQELSAGLVWVGTGGRSAFVEWRQRLGHRFLDEHVVLAGWRIER